MRNHLKNIFWLHICFVTGLTVTACSKPPGIESSLQTVQSILDNSNQHNTVNYQLSFDDEFPCQIILRENWSDEGTDWHQLYRFDLTDVEAGTFVQSKTGRRAIIYSGYKQSFDMGKKEFREIGINNLRFRSELGIEEQQQLIDAWNRAVGMCEEKYLIE